MSSTGVFNSESTRPGYEESVPEDMRKSHLLVVKGQKITKADYRGLLALILVIAFVYTVLTGSNCNAVAALGPLTGSAVTYYFHSRSSSNRTEAEVS